MGIVFFPVVNAVLMSLQNYDLKKPREIAYNNFGNYIKLFQDYLFWGALQRTALWVILGVGCQFVGGFALALLLSMKFKIRGPLRALSLIPWCTPGVLVGLMWRWIYDLNTGVLNDLLSRIVGSPVKIAFLARLDTAFPSAVVAIAWQGIPFFALMLLAGLQGIPEELYESADIDGANAIQKFRRITVPSIANTIYVSTMLRIIWVANSLDIIYNMTQGGPAYSTSTLSVYVYIKAMALDMGYASAMSVMLMILLAFVAILYVRAMFRRED